MTKRTIIYARVSTAEQADKGKSLPTQVQACIQYAERMGMQVVEVIQEDISGGVRIRRRPGGGRVDQLLQSGQADAVIFYAVDRYSRRTGDAIVTAEDWLDQGSEMYFLDIGQLTDPNDLSFIVKGYSATDERRKILERTQRGKRAKAADGKWVGNSHPNYGYCKVGRLKECKLAINGAEAIVVRQIFERFVRGGSIHNIADELTAAGVPAPSRGKPGKRWYEGAIKYILRSRACLGTFRNYGQTLIYPELAIIDADLWEAAQRRLAINRRDNPNGRKRDYLLSAFLHCRCGKRMYGLQRKPHQRVYLYYICYGVMHRLGDCHESVLLLSRVDAIVWGWITSILCDDVRREAGLHDFARRRSERTQATQAELNTVDELIAKAEHKVSRYAAELGDASSDEVVTALRAQMQLAGRDLAGLRARRAGLQDTIEQGTLSQAKIDDIARMTAAIRRRLPGDPTTVQRRNLFDGLGVEVKLRRDEADLRWLDMSCGIPDWSFSAEYDSSQTAVARGNRLVILSTSIPYDDQPGPALAEVLFSGVRWPAPITQSL